MKLATLDPAHPGLYLANNLINCTVCKFAHLYPLPDAATVDRYYSGDYFYGSHSPPDWFEKERREYEAGLWDAYYSYLASLLDPDKPVIDYGCASGLFLDYLWKHGWPQYQLYGVEPSRTAWQASPIKHRLYKELPKGDGVIRGNVVLSLVLEHIPDPARFLQEDVLPHLGPSTSSGRGGWLVVVVPNEWNLAQQWINQWSEPSKKNWFVSQVHVNYWDKKSIRKLLERIGLKVVYQGSTAPLEVAILLGYDYRGNDEKGRKLHNFRLKLETRIGPKIFSLYGFLHRLLGIGRETIIVAER